MTQPHNNAVEVRGISKIFGTGPDTVRALDGVSLAIRENEFFTLLGPSGCGKTTLLRLIAGFEQPSAGEILLDGEAIAHLPPYKRPVNTVFQSYALFPHMSVAENIGFGLEMLGKNKAETSTTVERMLALVRLQGMAERRPTQLSGGQQQRVALARALATHPKVLLLDEPLSALDLKLRKEMQIELKRLQHETGITFVFVTHDQEEALTMSDHLAVMNEGEILQVGSPTDIYEHPARRFVADFIGETNFLNAELIRIGADSATVRLATGVERKTGAPRYSVDPGPITITIRPERVSLGRAVDTADLSGEVEHIVYFGTDTIYHLRLPDRIPFIARIQNRDGARIGFAIGDRVGIRFGEDALQVLRD